LVNRPFNCEKSAEICPSIHPKGCTIRQNRVVASTALGLAMGGHFDLQENKMSPSLTTIAPMALILIGSVALSGCATKGFVREQVAVVNQRVDALDAKLQQTDGTAQQALGEARSASGLAQQNGQRIDQLGARVDSVEQRMVEAQRKRPRN
jgi:hypothetical protein